MDQSISVEAFQKGWKDARQQRVQFGPAVGRAQRVAIGAKHGSAGAEAGRGVRPHPARFAW